MGGNSSLANEKKNFLFTLPSDAKNAFSIAPAIVLNCIIFKTHIHQLI